MGGTAAREPSRRRCGVLHSVATCLERLRADELGVGAHHLHAEAFEAGLRIMGRNGRDHPLHVGHDGGEIDAGLVPAMPKAVALAMGFRRLCRGQHGFDGTQPAFRQSPPMASFSNRTTDWPNARPRRPPTIPRSHPRSPSISNVICSLPHPQRNRNQGYEPECRKGNEHFGGHQILH